MVVVMFVTLLVLVGCPLIVGSSSGDNKSGSDSSDRKTSSVSFDISPTQGSAGSIVQLTGLSFSETRLAELELWIGGEPTVFGVDDDVWTAALPLFLDESGWPRPPSQPQSVELRENDTVVATARQKVTITELPPAPGTTAAIQSELDEISQGFAELLNAFGGGSDYAPAVAAGSIAALESLISDGDYSLAAVLDGTSPLLEGEPADLELIDALLSVSGALEYLEALNEFLNVVVEGNESETGIHALSAGGVTSQSLPATDRTLAAGIQIYVIIDDLSATYFGPNAQAWARVTALIAISRVKVPHAAIVGAILTVTDFVMGSVVPGLLPATIEEFELALDESVIDENELTSSTVQITAVNSPPVMTVTEVIELAVTALGLRSSVETETLSGFLYKAVESTLNRFNRALSDHIAKAGLDPVDEFSVPNMRWGPVEIRNPDLVELVTSDPSIVAVDEEAMEWRGVGRGTSNVGVRTRGAGARSNMLPLPFRLFYHGGAFGHNSAWADASVRVGEGGDIVVTITGLPEGVPASVLVDGPEYEQGVSANATLEHLECGVYLIFAFDVRDDEETVYSPTPNHEVQTVVLENRDVVEVTVVYEPQHGDLELEITGLPAEVAGDVMLIGPDYERQFAESQLIENLVTGTYTIEAREVVVPGATFEPTPPTQTVDVTIWDTAVAEVVYQEIRDLQLNMRVRGGPWFQLWAESSADRYYYVAEYALDRAWGDFFPTLPWEDMSELSVSRAESASEQSSAVSYSAVTNKTRAAFSWSVNASSVVPIGHNRSIAGAMVAQCEDSLYFEVINDRYQDLVLEVSYSYAMSASGSCHEDDTGFGASVWNHTFIALLYGGGAYYEEIIDDWARPACWGGPSHVDRSGSVSIPVPHYVHSIAVIFYWPEASAGVTNTKSNPAGRSFSSSHNGEINLRLLPTGD